MEINGMDSSKAFEHLMWIYSTLVQASATIVAIGGTVILFMKEQYERRKEKNNEEVYLRYPNLQFYDDDQLNRAINQANEHVNEKELFLKSAMERNDPSEVSGALYSLGLLRKWISFRENRSIWSVRSILLMGVTAIVSGGLILVPESWYEKLPCDYLGAMVCMTFFAIGICLIVYDIRKILSLP